jgi:SAM-dependent methyltransferase
LRLDSPSALRNRGPILEVLRGWLPSAGTVLEVASGSGQHVAHFAAALADLCWQPSDPVAEHRASIDAWCAGLANVLPAVDLDATAADWPIRAADAVLCINMIHIAPWAAAEGLLAGAGRVLPPGGKLAIYGPFRRAGREMEPSNAAFDADLRRRDPAWGLREIESVAALAAGFGFSAPDIVSMPANNLTLLFRRP